MTNIASGVNIITISLNEWEEIPVGQVVFHFLVNDSAGNEYSTTLNIVKIEDPENNGIPGYSLPILFGCISSIIGLVIWNFNYKKKTKAI